MSLISVIIPAYNAQKTIYRCLESILNQTYRNIEAIVVNDGSSDDTENICRQFEDERVRIVNQKNQGVSQARNTGIALAQGKYICFVDSDDYLMECHIETMYKAMEETKAELVITNFYRIDHQGQKQNTRVPSEESCEIKQCAYDIYTKELLNQPWNKLFIKDRITELFRKNLSLGEDLIFNIDYLKNIRRMTVLDAYTYVYDLQLGGGLHKKKQTEEEFFYLYQYLYDGIINQGIDKRRKMDVFVVKHYIRFLKENHYGFRWNRWKALKQFAERNRCSRAASSWVLFYLMGILYCISEDVKAWK